ncbi:hypothetical protein D9M68_498950 [compost metagenome]
MNGSDYAEGEAADGTRAASRNVDLEAGHAQLEEDQPADGAHDSQHGVTNDDAQGDLFPKTVIAIGRCLAVDWRVTLSPDAFEVIVHFFDLLGCCMGGGDLCGGRSVTRHVAVRAQVTMLGLDPP